MKTPYFISQLSIKKETAETFKFLRSTEPFKEVVINPKVHKDMNQGSECSQMYNFN